MRSRESHLPASVLQRDELAHHRVRSAEGLRVDSDDLQEAEKSRSGRETRPLRERSFCQRGHHSHLSLKSCLDPLHSHTLKHEALHTQTSGRPSVTKDFSHFTVGNLQIEV